jgi:hypothetical protein
VLEKRCWVLYIRSLTVLETLRLASQDGDPGPGVHRQFCNSVSDNIALTGLHAHPEFHAEVTGSGRWTGGPRSTWQRSGPTLVWKEPDEGVEGVRHGHPIDRSRGGAPARWWGLGILSLA